MSFSNYRLFLWGLLKRKIKFIALTTFLLLVFFFTACSNKKAPSYRIPLDKNWQYSLQGNPYPFYDININDFNTLYKLLDSNTGYVFLKTTFTLPSDFKHKEVGLAIGRVKIAAKIYINNHSIGKSGNFPPNEFIEGNKTFAYKIPKEYLNIGGENTIMICLWCHGYGSIGIQPFISDYTDVEDFSEYYTFIHSKFYFILSTILIIINFIYLFLYILRRSEIENLSFSQLCLFTSLYLCVFYYGDYAFLRNLPLTYLTFEKIFKGTTALLTGYMIICFTRDFLHYKEKTKYKVLRFIITFIGIIIPLTATNIPDFRNRLRIGFLFIILQFLFIGKILYFSAKKKDKRLLHFLICLTPFLFAFTTQIIAKVFFKQTIDTLFLAISWVIVIFLFLGILIIHFVHLANEVENMNKNLEIIVNQRTEALEKEKNSALQEIDLAGFVQKSFYKVETSELYDWDLKYTFKPMSGVSGDLYIIFITENHLDGIGIFDISGHGIASGLVTMLVKNIIEQEFKKGSKLPLNEVMEKINTRIIAEKGSIENYLTGLLIRFNEDDIELVNAGHPKAILYNKSSGKINNVEQEGINQYGAIGIADFPINFETVRFTMEKGDELVLYTDGITDCMSPEKKYFGYEGVLAVFKANLGLSVKDQVTALPAALRKFSETDNFNDDITYIILKKLV